MNVTLYAICRNEEKNVQRFIENSKKFSHTVVVDTGSTDNTVQLLRDAGITVYEHSQTRKKFDFSKARNKALSYVETDWALSLDFNEDVSDLHLSGFEMISEEFTAFNHERYDKVGDNDPTIGQTSFTRFHRTKSYVWENAVHEKLVFVPSKEYLEESTVDTTIKITKDIFNSVDKELFYLSICEREFKKNPKNTYYLWFIFKHYYEVKDNEKVLDYGQQYLSISVSYMDPVRVNIFIICSQILLTNNNLNLAANYAFHALSEGLNHQNILGKAFLNLKDIGQKMGNPNIVVFATAFSEETLYSSERTSAIDNLFLRNIDDCPVRCWIGHRTFAEWLVQKTKPNVIVDLGVDWGYSTFAFSIPKIGHVYGIDSFEGDNYAGGRSEETYHFVMGKRKKLHLEDNLTIIKGYFDDVAKTWDKKIDILHIDGSHDYNDVKNDFETWSKFLDENGIVLFHDTMVGNLYGNEYGVKKFFAELDLPKCEFTHSYGLGVVSRNKDIIDYIKGVFKI